MKKRIFITQSICLLLAFGFKSSAQRVAAGGWHSLTVCLDSTVRAFGENASGQLGDGTTTDNSSPLLVSGLTGIIAVSAGGDQLEAHSLALKSNGTVWAWGSNLYGGLGNGSTTNSTAPVQVLVLNNVKAISAGGWHSVALRSDSTVWSWGWNGDGQLGDGTLVDKLVAAQIPGLDHVIAIAAGTYHVLALKDDGTVWAWGDNVSGQIGNSTTTDQLTPVQVSGLTNVVKIAAGRFFSLAVKNDGTVWTWGENLYGQLGNGTTTDSPVPVQVNGLTGVTSATCATGAFHCLAEKNDGTVWAWGRNTYGNLGDNTVTHSSIPVQMLGISDVAGMACGTNFSLVYKDDGTFWGCGRNASGQLGDGTVLQHNVLTQSNLMCPMAIPASASTVSEINSFVNISPNPSTSGVFKVHLMAGDPLTAIRLTVFNQLGQPIICHELMSFANDLFENIDLSNQPAGNYIVKINTPTSSFIQKLIKQ